MTVWKKEIYGLNLQEKAAFKYKLKKRIMEFVLVFLAFRIRNCK